MPSSDRSASALRDLRRPLILTRAGLAAERLWRAFWPALSVLMAVMAALMLGLAFGFGLALPGGWAWAAVLTAGAALAGLRRKKVLAALCLAMLAGLASNAAAQPLPPTMEERIS